MQPLVEGEIEDILWRHNGNKMVEWDNKAVNISQYLKFKGRIKLDLKTGYVTILNMTKDDSGLYDAEVIIRGKLINLKHRVEVTGKHNKLYSPNGTFWKWNSHSLQTLYSYWGKQTHVYLCRDPFMLSDTYYKIIILNIIITLLPHNVS